MNIQFTIITQSYIIYKSIADILIDEYGNVSILEKIDHDDLSSIFNFAGRRLLIVDWVFMEKYNHYLRNIENNIIILPILSDESHIQKYKQFDNFIFLNDDRRRITNKINKSLEPISKSNEVIDTSNELSKRETLILQLVAKGHTTKMIAEKLNISNLTVSSHRKNIGSKLGIKTASGLTTYAILNGIIDINETNTI